MLCVKKFTILKFHIKIKVEFLFNKKIQHFRLKGHDTTASAISWTLYSLAQHPEHQQKCYEEISALLADRNEQNFEW